MKIGFFGFPGNVAKVSGLYLTDIVNTDITDIVDLYWYHKRLEASKKKVQTWDNKWNLVRKSCGIL